MFWNWEGQRNNWQLLVELLITDRERLKVSHVELVLCMALYGAAFLWLVNLRRTQQDTGTSNVQQVHGAMYRAIKTKQDDVVATSVDRRAGRVIQRNASTRVERCAHRFPPIRNARHFMTNPAPLLSGGGHVIGLTRRHGGGFKWETSS